MTQDEKTQPTIEPEGATRYGKATEEPDAEGHGRMYGKATEDAPSPEGATARAGRATEHQDVEGHVIK